MNAQSQGDAVIIICDGHPLSVEDPLLQHSIGRIAQRPRIAAVLRITLDAEAQVDEDCPRKRGTQLVGKDDVDGTDVAMHEQIERRTSHNMLSLSMKLKSRFVQWFTTSEKLSEELSEYDEQQRNQK